MRARSNHPAAARRFRTCSSHPRGSASPNSRRDSGRARCALPIEDKIDKPGRDYARGSSTVRGSRAADGQCPGGRGAPPDFRFSRPLRARRTTDDCSRRSRRSGSLRLPASASCGRGETTTAVNLAAALAMRGHKTLLIDLAPKPTAVSRSWTTARSIAACTTRSPIRRCELARIIQQPRDASEPVRRTREDRPRQTRGEIVGELDAHFRLKDKIDKPGRDYARRLRLSADSRAAHEFNVLVNPVLPHPAVSVITMHDKRTAWRGTSGNRFRRANAVTHPGAGGGHRKCQNGRLYPADNERIQK